MISLMFHSAGLNSHSWRSSHISDSLRAIGMKLYALYAAGYETIFIDEALRNRDNKSKRICITFDDGYLDNWVHIFPLLKRYSQRATIFITPEFIDPRHVIRSQIAVNEVDDSKHNAAFCCAGFLSWCELREMEKSGLVDVQCHALTHTWYFKSPRIVDFWHPGSATEEGGAVWMLWNQYPESKPYYLSQAAEQESMIPYGTPIYEHGKSLETQQYFPADKALVMSIQRYLSEHGGRSFFSKENWRAILYSLVEKHSKQASSEVLGCFESDHAYYERVRYELSESKRRIEHELNKDVHCLCWPGGGVTEQVVDIARQVGYSYFTLPTKWRMRHTTASYRDMLLRRSSLTRICIGEMVLGEPTKAEFLWYLNQIRGYRTGWLLLRLIKLVRLLLYIFRPSVRK